MLGGDPETLELLAATAQEVHRGAGLVGVVGGEVKRGLPRRGGAERDGPLQLRRLGSATVRRKLEELVRHHYVDALGVRLGVSVQDDVACDPEIACDVGDERDRLGQQRVAAARDHEAQPGHVVVKPGAVSPRRARK